MRRRQSATIVGVAVAQNYGIKLWYHALDVHLKLAAADMERSNDVIGFVLFLVADVQCDGAACQQAIDLFGEHTLHLGDGVIGQGLEFLSVGHWILRVAKDE